MSDLTYMGKATATIHVGDCRDGLRALPADSVHCVVTSPPYWGLRDYGVPPTMWGGSEACVHDFAVEEVATEVGKGNCRFCGAWLGCLGLEPTPEMYVVHLVGVFREVRRVLRPDGTCWVNMGDCYATGVWKVGDCPGGGKQGEKWHERGPTNRGVHTIENSGLHALRKHMPQVPDRKAPLAGIPTYQPNRMPIPGLKPKDLVGMPWRLAFALQSDGWWLRSDIIWAKLAPMPESVTDRPTKAHEYLFLLAKSARYFYDAEAIKEPATYAGKVVTLGPKSLSRGQAAGACVEPSGNGLADEVVVAAGRNKRTVWTIASEPFPDAHFATFPQALVEPCVLAGTSARGVCPACGAPWERVVQRSNPPRVDGIEIQPSERDGGLTTEDGMERTGLSHFKYDEWLKQNPPITTGWKATCPCPPAEPVPATVLDPFSGSGTTGVVALKAGRNYVGCELNPVYAEMSRKRLATVTPLFATVMATTVAANATAQRELFR